MLFRSGLVGILAFFALLLYPQIGIAPLYLRWHEAGKNGISGILGCRRQNGAIERIVIHNEIFNEKRTYRAPLVKTEIVDYQKKHLLSPIILNPDEVICHLDPEASFNIEVNINKGRGWVPADENQLEITDIQTLAIDSIYTPIKNVKYSVENFRVDQKTDYEKLIIEITTNGSILPQDALKEAAKIMIYHLMLFSDEKITIETTEADGTEEFDEEVLHMRQLLKTKLVDMDLSVRALNCLKSAEVETLGELVVFNKTDLLKFRNFGKKSLTELDELLANLGLSFGMDISKYKLDKD